MNWLSMSETIALMKINSQCGSKKNKTIVKNCIFDLHLDRYFIDVIPKLQVSMIFMIKLIIWFYFAVIRNKGGTRKQIKFL